MSRNKLTFIAGLFALLLPMTSFAAIAFDAGLNKFNTASFSFTVAAGATIIVAGIQNQNSAGDTCTSLTWNGQPFTLLVKQGSAGSTPFFQYLYVASTTNAGTGAHNIVETGCVAGFSVQVASYTGTDTNQANYTNFVSKVGSVSSTSISSQITITAATSWLAGVGAENNAGGDAWLAGITTSRADDGPGPSRSLGDTNGTVTTGAKNVRWGTGSSPDWTLQLLEIPIAPAGAATAPIQPQKLFILD